jgi:diacylglycerol kinase family enzyme
MSRWLAIANPHAGAFHGGNFQAQWMPRIEACVAKLVYTEGPGHATEIARAARGYDGIAVIGGDGTVFEVLAGIDHGDPPIAIVPAGRGNCLALDLGVGSMAQALAAIARGRPVAVDLMALEVVFADGRRGDYRAASTLAVGYVAHVVARARHLLRLGRYAYAASAVCTRPPRLRVESRYGAEPPRAEELASIVINNTSYLANFRAFPRASYCDGLIDVLELDAGWVRQMLHNISVLSQSYFYTPGREFRAPALAFRLAEPGLLMMDGELLEGVAEFGVRCLPGAATFQRSAAR